MTDEAKVMEEANEAVSMWAQAASDIDTITTIGSNAYKTALAITQDHTFSSGVGMTVLMAFLRTVFQDDE